MAVEVVFNNGTKGNVDRRELNLLINSRLITDFKRSTGWVHIGVDPIRQKIDFSYGGEDKRAHY